MEEIKFYPTPEVLIVGYRTSSGEIIPDQERRKLFNDYYKLAYSHANVLKNHLEFQTKYGEKLRDFYGFNTQYQSYVIFDIYSIITKAVFFIILMNGGTIPKKNLYDLSKQALLTDRDTIDHILELSGLFVENNGEITIKKIPGKMELRRLHNGPGRSRTILLLADKYDPMKYNQFEVPVDKVIINQRCFVHSQIRFFLVVHARIEESHEDFYLLANLMVQAWRGPVDLEKWDTNKINEFYFDYKFRFPSKIICIDKILENDYIFQVGVQPSCFYLNPDVVEYFSILLF